MSIPVPWAIALIVAGALLITTALAVGVRMGVVTAPERALAQAAYLLAGGITGFMAIAFPPAWPVLAFISGILVISAWRSRRRADAGLFLAGFGAAWSLLLGTAIVNDMADPAVTGTGPTLPWLAVGAAVFLTGLAILVLSVARRA